MIDSKSRKRILKFWSRFHHTLHKTLLNLPSITKSVKFQLFCNLKINLPLSSTCTHDVDDDGNKCECRNNKHNEMSTS